jgi:MFS transporter, DHA2 family, multidrug resistance protein
MSETGWTPRANPWVAALAVTMGAFMEVLDSTIVNVALPHIAGSLSVSNDDATWVLSTYLVANGIVLTISGALSRHLGRKRYFIISVIGFTAASLCCALATEMWQLLLFRAAQGFFGGGLQPTQQAIVISYFPPEKRAAAFGLGAVAIVVGPILGPILGGVITDTYSWRWIFLINIPVGIATCLAVLALIEDPPDVVEGRKTAPPFDLTGICFIALALGCLEIAVDQGENADWLDSPAICTLFALSAFGFIAGIIHLLRAPHPIVDLRVLRDRNLALGTVQIGLMGFLLYASAVLIPQFAQIQLGYTATLAGLVLAPGAVVLVVLIPITGKLLMPNIPTKYIVVAGGLTLSAALFACMNLIPQLDFNHLVLYRVWQTACFALLFVPISTIAYKTLSPEQVNDASALFNMARNVIGGLGVSISTAIVTTRAQVNQAHLVGNLTPENQGYNTLLAQLRDAAIATGTPVAEATSKAMAHMYLLLQQQAAVLAYSDAFGITATMALGISLLALFMSGGVSAARQGE